MRSSGWGVGVMELPVSGESECGLADDRGLGVGGSSSDVSTPPLGSPGDVAGCRLDVGVVGVDVDVDAPLAGSDC